MTPISTASAAAPARVGQQNLLGPIDILLASLTTGLSAAQVQGLLTTLGITTPAQIADLLAAANPAQLAVLLGALTPAQLASALDALSSQELLGVLGGLGTGDLAGVFALLDPAQLTGLLALPGGQAQVLDGLLAVVAGLTAGTPAAAAVDAFLAQLEAVLGDVSPDQLGDFDALLAQVAPLLSVAGLDPDQLASLTDLLQDLSADTPTEGILGLLGILAPAGTPKNPSSPGTPGSTTPGGTPTAPVVTTFRATLQSVKVAKNRRSVRLRVVCPATAPGCLVGVNGKVGKRAAFKQQAVALYPGTSKALTVKLARPASRKLRGRKGGKLTLSAVTAGSSLGVATATAKVKGKRKR